MAESSLGFTLLRELMGKDLLQQMRQYLLRRYQTGRFSDCEQCPGSQWIYDDPGLVEVHKALVEPLRQRTGIELAKSFVIVRRYVKGSELPPHIDREAAQFVLSVTVANSDNRVWPLYLSDRKPESGWTKTAVHAVNLPPGDGVLFKGGDLYHWRQPLQSDWHLQVFFFFVDKSGPFAEHADDKINKYKDVE